MATATSKATKMQPETEIAILQFQVKSLEDKIVELKVDLKALHDAIEANAEETRQMLKTCLLYTSPSPRDGLLSRMPSSA